MEEKYTISPEVQHFLETMGFGIRHVTPDGLRVILTYALICYLHKQKPLEFLVDVAVALHNQTAILLTPDLIEITEKLQEMKLHPKSPEATQKWCREMLEDLEKEHTNAKQKDTMTCCNAHHKYQSVCYHENYCS